MAPKLYGIPTRLLLAALFFFVGGCGDDGSGDVSDASNSAAQSEANVPHSPEGISASENQ